MQDHLKLYSDLKQIGVDVDKIVKFNPTKEQLVDLRDGLLKLRSLYGKEST